MCSSDLEREQKVYEQRGVEEYLKYQVEHENEPFAPGPAFAFVKVTHTPTRTHTFVQLPLFFSCPGYKLNVTVPIWARLQFPQFLAVVFDHLQALETVNAHLRELYPDSEELFDIVLVTYNHAHVGVRLINTINYHSESETHTHKLTHTHSHTHTYTHTHTHTLTHRHSHMHSPTHTHTDTHTYTRTHTDPNTLIQTHPCPLCLLGRLNFQMPALIFPQCTVTRDLFVPG